MTGVPVERRTGWLLQVPGRVLRALAGDLVTAVHQQRWLTEQEIGFRDAKAALKRLTTEQLIELINAFPDDVPDSVVEALFEEYRHGRSPTVHLYTAPPTGLVGFDLQQANERLRRAVGRANSILVQEARQGSVQPRLRELAIESLVDLGRDWPGGLHAGYHCQSRMDYVATDGTAASICDTPLSEERGFCRLMARHDASLRQQLARCPRDYAVAFPSGTVDDTLVQ